MARKRAVIKAALRNKAAHYWRCKWLSNAGEYVTAARIRSDIGCENTCELLPRRVLSKNRAKEVQRMPIYKHTMLPMHGRIRHEQIRRSLRESGQRILSKEGRWNPFYRIRIWRLLSIAFTFRVVRSSSTARMMRQAEPKIKGASRKRILCRRSG